MRHADKSECDLWTSPVQPKSCRAVMTVPGNDLIYSNVRESCRLICEAKQPLLCFLTSSPNNPLGCRRLLFFVRARDADLQQMRDWFLSIQTRLSLDRSLWKHRCKHERHRTRTANRSRRHGAGKQRAKLALIHSPDDLRGDSRAITDCTSRASHRYARGNESSRGSITFDCLFSRVINQLIFRETRRRHHAE